MGDVAVTERVIATSLAVPAQTLANAPVSTAVDLGQTQITGLRIIVPRGHVGLTGLAVFVGGTRVVPWIDQGSAWLISDDDKFDLPLNTQAAAGITMRGFNTGQLRHTFYLWWTVNDTLYMRRPAPLLVPL